MRSTFPIGVKMCTKLIATKGKDILKPLVGYITKVKTENLDHFGASRIVCWPEPFTNSALMQLSRPHNLMRQQDPIEKPTSYEITKPWNKSRKKLVGSCWHNEKIKVNVKFVLFVAFLQLRNSVRQHQKMILWQQKYRYLPNQKKKKKKNIKHSNCRDPKFLFSFLITGKLSLQVLVISIVLWCWHTEFWKNIGKILPFTLIFVIFSVHQQVPTNFSLELKGPYADHILIPPGSTGSSVFFGFKWKPIFF